MNKSEIQERIYSLKTDEDIILFVEQRIKELEEESEEKVVGQNHTDAFRTYISNKTHYKAAESFEGVECPDLVYDDLQPYIDLVKSIIQACSSYNDITVFRNIFFTINNYLPSEDVIGFERYFIYSGHKGKRLSIKTIHENACGFCSEKSGMAHNMFKFLGIDSEVILGGREGIMHSYNMVYPNGYEKEPHVLYDPSFFLNFQREDKKYSMGFFTVLKDGIYERLMSGEPTKIDLKSTERIYREIYGKVFDGFEFNCENLTPSYVYGLVAAQNHKEGLLNERGQSRDGV